MLSELLLLSGNDIPFPQGGFTIHQPTLGEIAYIGEENFFIGLELLKFSKDILQSEDKIRLSSFSDFNIFMQILMDKNMKNTNNTQCAFMVLDLLFPMYSLSYETKGIVFHQEGIEHDGVLNEENFIAFKNILEEMFCANKLSSAESQYNPQGQLAKKIAEKLRNRHKQLAARKSQSEQSKKIAIFSRYISILAVGEQKDINSFMSYTVYQLFDEFERYELKMKYDVYFQARIAGASKSLEEPVDWMSDIHDPEFEGLVNKK